MRVDMDEIMEVRHVNSGPRQTRGWKLFFLMPRMLL